MERLYIAWPQLHLRRWQYPKLCMKPFYETWHVCSSFWNLKYCLSETWICFSDKFDIFEPAASAVQVLYGPALPDGELQSGHWGGAGIFFAKCLFRSHILSARSTTSGCPAQRGRVRWRCRPDTRPNRTQGGARWSPPRWKPSFFNDTLLLVSLCWWARGWWTRRAAQGWLMQAWRVGFRWEAWPRLAALLF